MLENVVESYRELTDARRGANDAYREGLKELKANYCGKLYEEKASELAKARDAVVSEAMGRCVPAIKESFESARRAIMEAAARPVPGHIAETLNAIDGLKVSDAEKAAIMEEVGGNYLAARKAAQIMGVAKEVMPPSLDDAIESLNAIEGFVMKSIDVAPDHYNARAICHGRIVGEVGTVLDGFVGSYGDNE